jgi:adenylate kinase
MKYRTILLFGAPGSGKGTQGKILGSIPGWFHCSCGEVFRSLRSDSELGQTFLQYSSKGELVPDEFTVTLWRDFIAKSIAAGRFRPETDTLVLDGIPRNAHQAEILSDALHVVGMLYLVCRDMDKLVARLQRRALHENRLDDANLDTIRRRFVTYERETAPVLAHYGKKLVHRVNATRTPIEVQLSILKLIQKL